MQHPTTQTPSSLLLPQVLAPSLKTMNGLEILLQYGGLTANVCFEEVLRCMLATQVNWRNLVFPLIIPFQFQLPPPPRPFHTLPSAAASYVEQQAK